MNDYEVDENYCVDCGGVILTSELVRDGYGMPLHDLCDMQRVAVAVGKGHMPQERYTFEQEREDDLEIAKDLIANGWMGTSNKHRTIARLPEGMTGLEALQRYAGDEYERIMARAEQWAADTYRRMHAGRAEGTYRTLDIGEWQAFKKAGGKSSW